MPNVILIKHAPPVVQPNLPPEQWPLSAEGLQRAEKLAMQLAEHGIHRVFSSEEIKAVETARVIVDKLAIPLATVHDLHEHDRSNVPHMPTREFISAIAQFFQKRDELVLGRETADQAEQRFTSAVKKLIKEYPQETLAIVSHGTVMSLLLSRHGGGDAFQLWRRLGLPSFVVMTIPDLQITTIVDTIT